MADSKVQVTESRHLGPSDADVYDYSFYAKDQAPGGETSLRVNCDNLDVQLSDQQTTEVKSIISEYINSCGYVPTSTDQIKQLESKVQSQIAARLQRSCSVTWGE